MATKSKYILKIENAKEFESHQIRVTSQGYSNQYITYGAKLLLQDNLPKIQLMATGNAMVTACTTSEVLKKKIKGLASIIDVSEVEVKEIYQPKEEGLDEVIVFKTLPILEIILAKEDNMTSEDKKAPGYQGPYPEDQVEEFKMTYVFTTTRARGSYQRGRGATGYQGRGSRQNVQRGNYRGGRRGRGQRQA